LKAVTGKKQHSKLDYNDYLRYFGNKMTDRERHGFERKAMQDPFDEEAFDGFSELAPGAFEKDMLELEQKISGKSKPNNRFYIGIAATVAVLVAFGITMFYISRGIDQRDLIAEQKSKKVTSHETPMEKSIEGDGETQGALPPVEGPVSESHVEMPERKTRITQKPAQGPAQKPEQEKMPESNLKELPIDTVQINREIEEVTVVGAYTQKSSDLTSAVASVPIERNGYLNKDSGVLHRKKDKKGKAALSDMPAAASIPEGKIAKSPSTDGGVNADIRYSAETVALSPERVKIKGKILSAYDQAPMPGVSVIEKGKTNGTVTNINGAFELEVEQGAEIEARLIGYVAESMKIGSEDYVELQLIEDLMALDEVVVVGYGSSSRENGPFENSFHVAMPSMKNADYKAFLLKQLDTALIGKYKNEVVKIEFKVDREGRLSDFSVNKTPNDKLAQQIIGFMQNGPQWNPAREGETPVEAKVRYRIKIE
jgi:translation initiation factor IF-1